MGREAGMRERAVRVNDLCSTAVKDKAIGNNVAHSGKDEL